MESTARIQHRLPRNDTHDRGDFADERKMFGRNVYKDADLDGPARKILQTGWAESTHDERKKQHDEFMAKIAEALHNASAIPQSVKH